MNWFSGNIAEAVTLSKKQNSVFVVYIEGDDEHSVALTANIDNARVRSLLESKSFVAIKIKSGSEAYTQFAEIYKIVPLPSIFFIGDNGAPLDIIFDSSLSSDDLFVKINAILVKSQPSSASEASANLLAAEVAAPAAAQTVSVNPAEVATTNVAAAAATSSTSTPDVSNEEQERQKAAVLQKAKEAIERARKEKEAESARLEKERELQRRRTGQDLKAFKQHQDELEMKQLKEERKRAKIEEQATRQRILAQIAQDRAINAEKFGKATAKPESTATTPTEPIALPLVNNADSARVQFKKPDGTIDTHTFTSSDTFQVLRDYVGSTVLADSTVRDFILARSFPRKEFSDADNVKSLLELDLAPSSVVLIVPLEKTNAARAAINKIQPLDIFSSAFWAVVSPMLAFLNYLRAMVFGGGAPAAQAASGGSTAETGRQKRESEELISDNDAAKRRNLGAFSQGPGVAGPSGTIPKTSESSAYKRVGSSNVHRLHENQDSDDDTNTWNGNSTQQQ